MRLHFLVLVAAILFIVIDGHPLNKRSEEEQDDDAAPSDTSDETSAGFSGDKKSVIDSKLDTANKDSENEGDNESRTEKLIDEVTESNSAELNEEESRSRLENMSGEKKDEVEDAPEEQDVTAEKKANIASKKDKKATKKELKKEEKDIDEDDEISEKKAAEIKSDEVHQAEEDDDESLDESAKKDKVKPSQKKEQGKDDAVVAAKETIAPGKDDAPAKGKKAHDKDAAATTDKVAEKKSNDKKGDDANAKKWWMVGDSQHWGGRGHGHWGPPHHAEQDNYGHGGHGHHKKAHVPACCKSKDKNVRKRCECEHHGDDHGDDDPHHLEGYHFHERGHGGHNDHDHDLKGPWAFGYDGFGDDWNDWDHNKGNFQHLQHLEKESHHGHHGDEGDHHDCSKKDCVQLPAEGVPGTQLSVEPLGGPVISSAAAPVVAGAEATNVIGPGAAPILGAGAAPIVGDGAAPILGDGGGTILGDGAAPILGAGPAPVIGPGPAPVIAGPVADAAPAQPVSFLPLPPAHHLPYRVCHDCHILKNGGSRCLCKAVKHPVHHASTNYDHHVYIDCDAAVHNYPYTNHLCYPRASIPTPEDETQQEGKPKQGVVYPYVGYGPWSAYPWWGDWWGGHGNHGWGGQNAAACGHPCEHEKHGCECQHHGDHQVDVDHGTAIVHHEHADGHGHHQMAHNSGHEVGFSLGHHGGPANLHAYRCHDVIENHAAEDPSNKAKRFCVPVGYHGGYGWPYWHGYPGVGTGLWGWGWPWIKNKVPGSKLKGGSNKTSSATGGDKEKEAAGKTNSRRSYIENSMNVSNKTKKQTIHVGYGYASGDNYRLGYGYGGMGGVAGFAPGANAIGEGGSQNPFSRSKIETEDASSITFTKNNIPTPEKEITVTGTKRDFEKSDNNEGSTTTNI